MADVTDATAELRPNGRTQTLRAGPRIAALSVAGCSNPLDQRQLLDLLGLSGDRFAEDVFARCGVRQRHLEVDAEVLATTLQERTAQTEEQLLRLAGRAVDGLELEPAEIGVVVTASYYSLGGPTLAHRLIERCGFGPDTDKYHLTGVGCASAVPLLRLAGQALRDRPEQQALVVAAESVSGFLTPVADGDARVKVVGASLFGDGCAAALLTLSPGIGGPAAIATAVHQVPGTLDHVRFSVGRDDSHMQIARELPHVAETQLPALVDSFLQARGLTRDEIDHWLVHPGGRGVIEGVQRGLELSDEQLAASVRVLAERGNVGTPSAFYVLAATQAESDPRDGEHGLMVTIGPGVTVGLMLLRW
jgi:predicted naringenin-chalcone synthase